MPKRTNGSNGGKNGRLTHVAPGGPVDWINVTDPTEASLAELKKLFPFFEDEDLQDCLPPFERPKLLIRDKYLFMVLLFPVVDRKTRGVQPYEVDFFIGDGFLVTSHQGVHPTLASLADACGEGSDKCVVRPNDDALRLALDIVHGLVVTGYPMVRGLSNELLGMENSMFVETTDGKIMREMLRLRTNILAFRKSMQGFENPIRKLRDRGGKLFAVAELEQTFDDLSTHAREIREFLDNDKDTIDALYDAHLSLVSYRAAHATKSLTALAFIVLPMQLVAAIFAMRAEHVPFVGMPDDFWAMSAVIFAVMLGLVLFIKRKKWL